MKEKIKNYLKEHKIEYIVHEHQAVFTVKESKKIKTKIQGVICKNLFLKERKERKYYLVVLPGEKRLNIKELRDKIQTKDLTFASSEELKEILNLTPGSVSILGLINDKEHEAELIIDKEINEAKKLNFHPNINTESIELNKENFHKLLKTFNNKISILTL